MKKIHLCYFIPLAIYFILAIDATAIGFLNALAFMLFFIGIIGSTETVFNHNTIIATIFGIAIIIACFIASYSNWLRLVSFFVGFFILIIALMTHNKGLSKLRLFYLTPAIVFVFWGFKYLHSLVGDENYWFTVNVIFEPFISIFDLCIAISISLFVLWTARMTIAGLNLILCQNTQQSDPPVSDTLLFDESTKYSNTPLNNVYTSTSVSIDLPKPSAPLYIAGWSKERALKTTLYFLIYVMAFTVILSTALYQVGYSWFITEHFNV